jgi:hypothetical protein
MRGSIENVQSRNPVPRPGKVTVFDAKNSVIVEVDEAIDVSVSHVHAHLGRAGAVVLR